MSEGPIPRSWEEATPAIVWVILIFAAGFEFISCLVHGEWWPSVGSFILMVGMTAILLHWRQITRWVPLAYAFGVLFIVITISPHGFGLWPFGATPIGGEIAGNTNDPLLRHPAIAWDGHDGPITFKAIFTRSGEKLPVYLDWGVLGSLPIDQGVLTGGFVPAARVEMGFIERFVRNEMLSVTLASVTSEANLRMMQWGDDRYHNPRIPMPYQSIAGRVVIVHGDKDEEYYPFIIVSRAIGAQANTPVIIGPGLFAIYEKWGNGSY
jgi:hypothetical protein